MTVQARKRRGFMKSVELKLFTIIGKTIRTITRENSSVPYTNDGIIQITKIIRLILSDTSFKVNIIKFHVHMILS